MSEPTQGNRLGQPVATNLTAAEISSRNPNRLVIAMEAGNINISYVRNHETNVSIRVHGAGVPVALALPGVNASSVNVTNLNTTTANSLMPSTSTAVPGQINQSVPGNLALGSNGENYLRCPVCFNPTYNNRARATICGHVFCGTCLEQCLATRPHCPICGTFQEYRHSLPLYF